VIIIFEGVVDEVVVVTAGVVVAAGSVEVDVGFVDVVMVEVACAFSSMSSGVSGGGRIIVLFWALGVGNCISKSFLLLFVS